DAHSRAVRLRSPVFAAYGKPDLSRKLIRQSVESEGRNKADNGFRGAFGNLRQTVVVIEFRIGKLIKTAGKPHDLTIPFHSAHGSRRHACIPQFREACYPAFSEHGSGDLALR